MLEIDLSLREKLLADRVVILEVYTMRADGGDQMNRTKNETSNYGPDWQPLEDDAHRDDD